MSDLLTVEDFKNLKEAFDLKEGFVLNVSPLDLLMAHRAFKQAETIQAKNDELQAQVRGLVEALRFYAAPMPADYQCPEMTAVNALSTLPAEWLERERKREAVIQAAMEWKRIWNRENFNGPFELPQDEKLYKSVEALEAKQ